jgi:BON domain
VTKSAERLAAFPRKNETSLEGYMLRNLCVCLLLTVNVSAIQQKSESSIPPSSCTTKAEECKDPVTNPKHYEDRHCTCFTCRSGTDEQKVLCTNDENEAGRLLARVEPSELKSKPVKAEESLHNTIQSAIQEDPSLANAKVTVEVKDGKSVALSGTVPSKDAKDSAERIAKENSGDLKVKNNLKVTPAGSVATPDKPKTDTSSPKL